MGRVLPLKTMSCVLFAQFCLVKFIRFQTTRRTLLAEAPGSGEET